MKLCAFWRKKNTDDIDIITYPSFKFIRIKREKEENKRTGGITAAYKDNIKNKTEIQDTPYKYVLWFIDEKKYI